MLRTSAVNAFCLLLLLGAALHAEDTAPDADELFKTLDANSDGTLTSDEISEAQQKAFRRLLRVGDANDDGQLTRQEYAEGLRPQAKDVEGAKEKKNSPGNQPEPPRDVQPKFNVDRLFERIDRNSDGKIALDEVPEPLQARLQPIFDRLDKEELTRADFEKFRRFQSAKPGQGMRPDGERPQIALIKLLDADNNGKISQEELAKLSEKFSELDLDGDGQLAPRELFGFGGGPMVAGGKPAAKRPDGKKAKSRKTDQPDASPKPEGNKPDVAEVPPSQ